MWLLLLPVLDQIIKTWLFYYSPQTITINTGVAFGLGSIWLVLIGVAIFLGIGWYERFQPRIVWLTILLAALSNGIDRFRVGGVIDYLSFFTLNFNIADLIIIGSTAYLIYSIRQKHSA